MSIPKVGVTFPNLPGGKRTTLLDTDIMPIEASGLTYYFTIETLIGKIWSDNRCTSFCDTITIATADVLTLYATPIQVIAAPGAGYIVYPESAFIRMDYNSATYSGGNLIIYQNSISYPIFYTDSYTNGADVCNRFSSLESESTKVNFLENTATYIAVSGANPTTGDSDLVIDITWKVRAV